MPSPISHIAYGQKFLEGRVGIDEGAFIRGTIFPDIRYLVKIPREKTHRSDVKLADALSEPEAWRAGWLFHNWVDVEWADYFIQFGLDPGDIKDRPLFIALKILEQEALLARVKPLSVGILEKVDESALGFGVVPTDIKQWGVLVEEMVVSSGSGQEKMLRRLGITETELGLIEVQLERVRQESVWGERLSRLYERLLP